MVLAAGALGQDAAARRVALSPRPPSVLSITPRYGPLSGGTFGDVTISKPNPKGTIVIHGRDFSGAKYVLFGSIKQASFSVNPSGTAIAAVPPPEKVAAGVVIRVVTSAGVSPTGCPVIQQGCADAYFYLAGGRRKFKQSLDGLAGRTFSSGVSRDHPDSPSQTIAQECASADPARPSTDVRPAARFSAPKGAELAGGVTLDMAGNGGMVSAFVGNASATLNQPLQITVRLSAAYGDCVEIPTPLRLGGVLGVWAVMAPATTGPVSYTLTIEPGTYSLSEGGWLPLPSGRGSLWKPAITTSCPGYRSCVQAGLPGWRGSSALMAGLALRLAPASGSEAYMEGGPAVGAGSASGAEGNVREACGGAMWAAHVNLGAGLTGVNISDGGPAGKATQLAGNGSGYPSEHCLLGRLLSGPPRVDSVSPAGGAATGGTEVTITGANFGYDSRVSFGEVRASGVVVPDPWNSGVIRATAPAGTGTVDVTVTNRRGTSVSAPGDRFTYINVKPPKPLAWTAAQWGATTNQDLRAISCPDGQHCLAVGSAGTIVATTDGSTWSNQTSGTADPLYGISCYSNVDCVAVGANGATLVTSTFGAFWSPGASGLAQGISLRAVSCASPSGCWAVGDSGTVISSTNGGRTWSPDNSGVSAKLLAISCPSVSTCIAGGAAGTVILKGADGSWAPPATSANASKDLNGASCARGSNTDCFVAGLADLHGAVRHTTDGGQSWNYGGSANELNAVSCDSVTNCVGVGNGGAIDATTDGADWRQRNSPTSGDLFGVSCPSSAACFGVGAGGLIIHTSDGGVDWGLQNTGQVPRLVGVSCLSTGLCDFAGNQGELLVTRGDATVDDRRSGAGALRGVSCASASNCFAVGPTNGTVGPVFWTDTGWSSWNSAGSTGELNAVSCPTVSICFAAGNAGAIDQTSDASDWNHGAAIGTQDLFGISCPTSTYCIAVGTGGAVFKTADSGGDWIQVSVPTTVTLYAVSCAGVSDCVAVGADGVIIGTHDGSTWKIEGTGRSEPLYGVSCPSKAQCWAVGGSGVILESADGGASWNADVSPTEESLFGISCPTVLTCHAAGDLGTIVRGIEPASAVRRSTE